MTTDFTELALHFGRAPLALGDAADGARLSLASDWLFRAIQSGWRELTGKPLSAESPGFAISSAFPFVGERRLLPLPERFAALAAVPGLDACFDRDAMLAGELRIVGPSDPAIASAWRVGQRPRAAMDRRSARRVRRFSVRECFFGAGTGLWFGARSAGDGDAGAIDQLHAVMRYLGDCGIGGNRSAGAGTFTVTRTDVELDAAATDKPAAWLVLSRTNLGRDEAALLDGDDVSVTLARTSVPTKPASAKAREPVAVVAIAEGSLLAGNAVGEAVSIPDAAIGLADTDAAHRYGGGFALPVSRAWLDRAQAALDERFHVAPVTDVTPAIPPAPEMPRIPTEVVPAPTSESTAKPKPEAVADEPQAPTPPSGAPVPKASELDATATKPENATSAATDDADADASESSDGDDA